MSIYNMPDPISWPYFHLDYILIFFACSLIILVRKFLHLFFTSTKKIFPFGVLSTFSRAHTHFKFEESITNSINYFLNELTVVELKPSNRITVFGEASLSRMYAKYSILEHLIDCHRRKSPF